MISLECEIPAKTFLLGEYGVLQRGSAIIANTSPSFKLKAHRQGEGDCHGIHPDSPAGLWLREHRHFYSQFKIEFIDPYQGNGGFGASTAQFLGVYCLHQFFAGQALLQTERDFIGQLLQDYWQKSWDGKGVRPSGADLLAQFCGQLSVVKPDEKSTTTFSWPFADKAFYVVHTRNKLATHEHLKSLKEVSFSSLCDLTKKAAKALEVADWGMWLKQVNDYRQELQKLNLTCDFSLRLLEELNSFSEVEGIKACGAMGADTIVIFFDRSQQRNLRIKLAERALNVVASHEDLTSGMKVTSQSLQAHQRETIL